MFYQITVKNCTKLPFSFVVYCIIRIHLLIKIVKIARNNSNLSNIYAKENAIFHDFLYFFLRKIAKTPKLRDKIATYSYQNRDFFNISYWNAILREDAIVHFCIFPFWHRLFLAHANNFRLWRQWSAQYLLASILWNRKTVKRFYWHISCRILGL